MARKRKYSTEKQRLQAHREASLKSYHKRKGANKGNDKNIYEIEKLKNRIEALEKENSKIKWENFNLSMEKKT